MAKKKLTKAQLEARAQMLKRNENLLHLALKAQADLDRRKQADA